MNKKYICACYYQRNIFLHAYKLHVTFINHEQFKHDYAKVLDNRGFKGDWPSIIEEVEKEIKRRKENGKASLLRKEYIHKNYVSLHQDLYELKESYLSPSFLKLVEYCKNKEARKDDLLKQIKVCKGDQIYSIPVFTKEFCQQFIEELKYFEESDMPKGRPNTMNKTGLLLEEMGFYPNFLDVLRANYQNPIASLLYPEWVGKDTNLDSQRAFVVSYKSYDGEESTDLALHFDNAEVTINISLSDGFEGGELYFGGMWQEPSKDMQPVEHKQSYGVIHRGRHMHGAMPLENGERYNLIIWMRSSNVRNIECPMCEKRPTLVETEGEGGGFTDVDGIVDVCNVI